MRFSLMKTVKIYKQMLELYVIFSCFKKRVNIIISINSLNNNLRKSEHASNNTTITRLNVTGTSKINFLFGVLKQEKFYRDVSKSKQKKNAFCVNLIEISFARPYFLAATLENHLVLVFGL